MSSNLESGSTPKDDNGTRRSTLSSSSFRTASVVAADGALYASAAAGMDVQFPDGSSAYNIGVALSKREHYDAAVRVLQQAVQLLTCAEGAERAEPLKFDGATARPATRETVVTLSLAPPAATLAATTISASVASTPLSLVPPLPSPPAPPPPPSLPPRVRGLVTLAMVHAELGWCYERLDRTFEAVVEFDRAQHHPTFPQHRQEPIEELVHRVLLGRLRSGSKLLRDYYEEKLRLPTPTTPFNPDDEIKATLSAGALALQLLPRAMIPRSHRVILLERVLLPNGLLTSERASLLVEDATVLIDIRRDNTYCFMTRAKAFAVRVTHNFFVVADSSVRTWWSCS